MTEVHYTISVGTYPGLCVGSRVYRQPGVSILAFYIPFLTFAVYRIEEEVRYDGERW